MNFILRDRYKHQRSFDAESKYYLEMTGYNLKKALDDFEEDMKFEKENMKKRADFEARHKNKNKKKK